MFSSSRKLRTQVLLGLSVFVMLVLLLSVYQLQVLKTSEKHHQILGEISQLEDYAENFGSSSENYLENVPRDFESYNRDVRVFNHEIQQDIDQVSARMASIASQFESQTDDTQSALLKPFFSGQQYEVLKQEVDEASLVWSVFLAEFREQLGTDSDAPRLEWGAEYIRDNVGKVRTAITAVVRDYRNYLNQQGRLSENILKGGMATVALLGLLGLIWFYRKVIKRIGDTVNACVQVANGDFGYTLSTQGNDELSVLARAFNMLSSRSQLIVNMQGDLQQAETVEQGLAAVVQASGSYLPVAWAAFMQQEPGTDEMRITNALPPKTLDNWNPTLNLQSSQFGREISDALVSNEVLLINELRQQALKRADDEFLRDLVKSSQLESLVSLPMSSVTGWQGVLLFGSRSAQYRKDQVELLKNLSRLMAISFEKLVR